MITHPLILAHSPNIILITNPPLEESMLWVTMTEGNWGGISRKQIDAKEYAEATLEVGKELGIPVVDAWGLCMERAGWKAGEELIGTIESGRHAVLETLLYDGKSSFLCYLGIGTDERAKIRDSFGSRWISYRVR